MNSTIRNESENVIEHHGHGGSGRVAKKTKDQKKNTYVLEMSLESSTTLKMNNRKRIKTLKTHGPPHTEETNELAENPPIPIQTTRVGRWICQAASVLVRSVGENANTFV